MSSYGVILDIEGCNVALATDARLDARHASEVRVALDPREFPSGMLISQDPSTGEMDAGGSTIKIRGEIADLLTAQKEAASGVTTRLDGEISKTATSLDVVDASGLASSGTVWIGREAIAYSGKSSNTLTGLTRASLGTTAQVHRDTSRVFSYNPTLLGRQIWISWQDGWSPSTSTAITRYVGFIDRVTEGNDGLAIQVVSGQSRLRDQAVFAGAAWFKGRLARSIGAGVESLKIALDDKDVLPPGENSNRYGRGYIRIDDEILEIGNWFTPLNSTVPLLQVAIDSVSSDVLALLVPPPGDLEVGDQVDLMDSTKATTKATVTVLSIDRDAWEVTIASSDYSHASGDLLVMNYTAIAPYQQVKRGVLGGGPASAHEKDAEVAEARILEGDAISDVLLPCLCSVDGDGDDGPLSGSFDVLPLGWGLGLPETFIEIAAFLEVVAAGRSQPRYYVCEEDLSISELITWLSITLNLAIFWSEEGKLTATLIEDIYPDNQVDHTLSEAWRKRGEGWSADSSLDRLRNRATVSMDLGLDGEPRSRLIVEVADSVDIHGAREIEIMDRGLRSAQTEVALLQILRGYLRQRTFESAYVTYKARISPSVSYRPGQIVTLVLPNAINHRGVRDIEATYQIVRVAPSDVSGYVELELMYRDTPADLGLIAPCGLVEAVAGDKIQIYTAATSLYADPDGRTGAVPILGSGTDGDEDIDYFQEGDLVTVWDESSLGGTVQKDNLEIASINYGTRFYTMATTPAGWVAAGDLVRLRAWSGFSAAPTASLRQGVFLALADGTTSPVLIGSDDPYVWGD
jgi:hypothetical protein